jgi:hypothetical protein
VAHWENILTNPGFRKCSFPLIPHWYRTTIALVNFLVHHILPLFEYTFLAGLLGAVPVIIVTAIKTAKSMFEHE